MAVVPRLASAGCALVVALAVVVRVTTDSAFWYDVSYLGVMVAASLAAWYAVARRPAGERLLPGLIAAGISLTALGDVLWTLLDRAGAGTDVSVADVPWFVSYVLLCWALGLVLSRSRVDGGLDVDFIVDAVTIVVLSVLIAWTFSVTEIVGDETISPFTRAVWASYPVLDAILLALVLRVLMSRRTRAAIDVWFAVGVCLWLAADVLYLNLPDSTTAMSVSDAAWMVAPVLLARAAWRTIPVRPQIVTTSRRTAGWVAQLLLAVLPLLVPPGLELVSDLRGRDDQPGQLLVGMALVMILALVRTGRLILSEQRAQHELEIARDEALAASEAKSMFLANMSHELRTPLTTVLAAGGLLSETPLTDTQQMLLGKVHRSGAQLQTLVEGLLDLSRIEAGRAVLQRAEFDLHALLAELVDVHRPRAEAKGIGFAAEIDPQLPQRVVGDEKRIFQVLSNLLENAAKFTEVGQVRLVARRLDQSGTPGTCQVQLSVTDTGIGIPEADQDSIFESFRQVDGSSTRYYQGTGLGLAICKELTELMGGTITVLSDLGVGSTFTVRLALDEAQSASAEEPAEDPADDSSEAGRLAM